MSTLYGFAYTPAALRAIEGISSPKIRKQIVHKIETLATNPHPQGSCKVQGMADGPREVFRIRQGDHRVLYSVDGESQIIVLFVGHRKDVYK